MLRRAASGHIEATQLSKFAAASRIADAVIRGWPEAPSSPLQGKAAPAPAGAAWACAEVPGRRAGGMVWPPLESEPVKMLPNRLKGPPPPEDCACAPPQAINAAATIIALVRPFAKNPVRRVMFHPHHPNTFPAFRRPCRGFQ